MNEKDFNIESRLCAYIDGLLDAEQREQIEQYLDRYPEHRQLIDQLMQERALLRDLPRESAPPDVLAHFQGQLERSVLLDDFSTDPAIGRSGRRGRWNLAAFLAILLLLGGLGVIVWIAMPPQRGPRSTNIGELPVLSIAPAAASEPATTTSVSESSSQPATPPTSPRPPEMLASVVNADSRIFVVIFSDNLAAAQERADQFLKAHGLSRILPPVSTQPASTQPATAQGDMIAPPPKASWLVFDMTPLEAQELAASFSTQPSTIAATIPATQAIPASRPTTQAQPASQPAVPIIIHFQMLHLPPNGLINPDR